MFSGKNKVAVIDGSTSKSDIHFDKDVSNGRLAMTIIKQQLAEVETMPLEGVIQHLQDRLFEQYTIYQNIHGQQIILPKDRLSASMAIYDDDAAELWLIGDCQALVDGEYFDNPKPMESTHAERRALHIRQLFRTGTSVDKMQSNDSGRALVLQDIIRDMSGQNNPKSPVAYAALDGFPICWEKVKKLSLDPSVRHEIVLASDGYPRLKPTLEQSEQALKRQLTEDPLCVSTFLATKGLMKGQQSFDDRAYIRFETSRKDRTTK